MTTTAAPPSTPAAPASQAPTPPKQAWIAQHEWDEQRKMVREIHECIVGTTEKPGLGEKVRLLQRVSENASKAAWAAVIVVIGWVLKNLLG